MNWRSVPGSFGLSFGFYDIAYAIPSYLRDFEAPKLLELLACGAVLDIVSFGFYAIG